MKRIITLALIAAMAFAMVACGSNEPLAKDITDESVDTAAVRSTFDKAVAYTESVMDTTGMTPSIQDDDGGAHLYKYWGYEEALGNDKFSMDVEIDGKTVTIGKTTVGELKSMGFELQAGNETVEPDSATSVYITKDGKSLSFGTETNLTDAAKKIDDMTICVLYGSMDEYTLPYNYMGFSADSDLKDVIDTLGVTKYMASLSVGSDSAVIELVYYIGIDKTEVSETSESLSIDLLYDAEKDTSKIGSIQLTYQVNEYVTEQAGE